MLTVLRWQAADIYFAFPLTTIAIERKQSRYGEKKVAPLYTWNGVW